MQRQHTEENSDTGTGGYAKTANGRKCKDRKLKEKLKDGTLIEMQRQQMEGNAKTAHYRKCK